MSKPQLFHPRTWVFTPIWLIGYVLDNFFGFEILDKYDEKSDGLERYPSTKKMELDFETGDKYIISKTSQDKLESYIKDYLDIFCNGNLAFENFQLINRNIIIMKCPKRITFFEFNLLTQHICYETKDSWGIFNSKKLSYYSYSDDKTVHNIIGRTNDGQKFSIYTLYNLDRDRFLNINQDLSVKNFNWTLINNSLKHLV